jgi:hypothetical protein
MKTILKILFVIAPIFSTGVRAEVIWNPNVVKEKIRQRGFASCTDLKISFVNKIHEKDIVEFKKFLEFANRSAIDAPCKNGTLIAHLSSLGGNVQTAIKIGRILRENEMYALVPDQSECVSACVFLFAGAVRRTIISGKIGIHRPYFESLDSNLTNIQIREHREKINLEIKKYFEEMDISISLLDAMLGVPPENTRYLSIAELNQFRLGFEDPTYSEKVIAIEAKKFSMNSAQYRQRKIVAEEKCLMKSEYEACWLSAILQLSDAEAKKRIKLFYLKCVNEKNLLIDENCRVRVYATGKI